MKQALEAKLENLSDIDFEIEAESIDRIFIEIIIFRSSYRMGVWEAPTFRGLPSHKIGNRHYALYVQGKTITVKNSELEAVVDEIRHALDTGAQTTEVRQNIIPEKPLDFLIGLLPMRPMGQMTLTSQKIQRALKNQIRRAIRSAYKGKFNLPEEQLTKPRDALDTALPSCKHPNITLKSHQNIGLNWLIETHNRGFPVC